MAITGCRATTIDVGDLLRALAAQACCQNVGRQVVWNLASWLELLAVPSPKTRSGSMLRVSTVDLLGIMWNRQSSDYELVKQAAAQPTYATGRVSYRFATDGAHVGGPSLLNTIVVR